MENIRENDILNNKIEIKYRIPKLSHRVLANLIDIIIFAVLFIGIFLISRAIITASPSYKEAHYNYENAALASGLYRKDKDQLVDLITYLSNDSSVSAKGKRTFSEKAIDDFYVYIKSYVDEDLYEELIKDRDAYFLSDSLKPKNEDISNEPYFIKSGNDIIPNPNLSEYPGIDLKYYNDCYKPYIDKYALRQFQSYSTDYIKNLNKVANMILFIAIPIAYVLGILLTWFVPPLIFKRGRKTLGKALYQIGLIQSDFYNLKFGKWLIRFLIFFLGEMVLSIATVGIPFIISVSMMIFSKHKQGFPDYMLGIFEVDTSNNKIYYNEAELTLDNLDTHKEPIDFKLPDIEY